MEGFRRGTRVKKKYQKTLILAFEVIATRAVRCTTTKTHFGWFADTQRLDQDFESRSITNHSYAVPNFAKIGNTCLQNKSNDFYGKN